MDVVCRGIQESKIRNNDISGCDKLHEVRAAVVQGMRGEPVPPDRALAVNDSIITWCRVSDCKNGGYMEDSGLPWLQGQL